MLYYFNIKSIYKQAIMVTITKKKFYKIEKITQNIL